jgi:DNA-binding LytR/AlgR family response regulator
MKLLIVEDEPLLRDRLLRLGRDIVGPAFSAVAVGTLAEAREHLHDRAFDGLILDLNLSGHDGFSLLREAVASALDVVVVSGHGERALEAFELGVLDFVPKPFGAARLAAALERLRRGSARGALGRARASSADRPRITIVPAPRGPLSVIVTPGVKAPRS